jgi:hypothetical protein
MIPKPGEADLLTCVDSVSAALANTLEHRRDLPDDIRSLLSDAIAVLAVTSAYLEQHRPLAISELESGA